MVLHLLGPARVKQQDKQQHIRPSKHAALLCYLAYHGRWISREDVALLFYADGSDNLVQVNFRKLLQRAKALEFALLETNALQLRFAPKTDVSAFLQALATQNWRKALMLYQGPLLQGFKPRNAPGFEHWLTLERSSLQSKWSEASIHYAKALEDAEQFAQAMNVLAPVLEQDLLNEDAVLHFMRAAYRTGKREKALETFKRFKQELEQSLGINPLRETLELAELIRRANTLSINAPQDIAKLPLEIQHPPQLIGRDEAMLRIQQSQAPVILVSGEAGIGKTRLMQDSAPEAHYLACLEGLENVPYFPLVKHLHSRIDTLDDLGVYKLELARFVPTLAKGKALPPNDDPYAKTRLLEAWAQYLKGSIIFDDIQWADAATLEVLIYLAQQTEHPIFVAYRSNEVTKNLQKTLDSLAANTLEKLELSTLNQSEVNSLLHSLMKHPKDISPFSHWLYKHSGGNPFFILETLKALFRERIDTSAPWYTQLDRPTNTLSIPPKLADMVQRRLKMLPETSQRILPIAAVFATDFTADGLSRLSGLSLSATLEALETAEKNGLISKGAFSHDLLRQSLYESISKQRRRFLHTQVANALSEANPGLLAKHWEAAEEKEKAAYCWLKAAKHARDIGLDQEAARLAERAITQGASPSLAKAKALLAMLYQQSGRFAEAETLIESVLKSSSEASVRVAALDAAANIAFAKGSLKEAKHLIAQAETLQSDEQDSYWLNNTKVLLLHAEGSYQEALTLVEAELASLDKKDAHYLLQRVNQAALYDCLERYEEAIPLHKRALSLAKALGSAYYQVSAAGNLLNNLIQLNRVQEGIVLAEEALALGYPDSDLLRLHLADAYRLIRQYDLANSYYQAVTKRPEQAMLCALAWSKLIKLHAELNENQQCQQALEKALESLEETDFPNARAVVCSKVLEFGEAKHKARIQPILESLDMNSLTPDIRRELERLLS